MGAVATQSFVKVEYGPDGLALMKEENLQKEALALMVDKDEGRDVRQVAMIDNKGNVAVHTGKNCIFAGHKLGKNYLFRLI